MTSFEKLQFAYNLNNFVFKFRTPQHKKVVKSSSEWQNSTYSLVFIFTKSPSIASISKYTSQTAPTSLHKVSVITSPRKCLERRLINEFILDPKTSFPILENSDACQKICGSIESSHNVFKIINLHDNYY